MSNGSAHTQRAVNFISGNVQISGHRGAASWFEESSCGRLGKFSASRLCGSRDRASSASTPFSLSPIAAMAVGTSVLVCTFVADHETLAEKGIALLDSAGMVPARLRRR
ncbi:hypothetical protein WCQ02_21880 [Paraburkholderia tropica]|uniref:hypothetical protein n=1 Tax=Paraburkholderia tropica TaxID=92647 RepID=UPI002ABD83FA|nr:hypothetical protein [Paraburkholderia tropica]